MDGTYIIQKTLEQSGVILRGACLLYGDMIRKLGLQQAYMNPILPVNSFMNWRLWESEHTLYSSTLGHPSCISNIDENINVMFLLPNTTSIIQPMGQGVIATFESYYLQKIFIHLVGTHLMAQTNFLWKISGGILTLKRRLTTLEMHRQKCHSPVWMEFGEIFGLM
jgi:hypothetical protein